jgi:hypothetical protein
MRRGSSGVDPNNQIVPVGHAAIREIIAGVTTIGGAEGLTDLTADLAARLAELIKQVAAEEGRAAVDVAADLFDD